MINTRRYVKYKYIQIRRFSREYEFRFTLAFWITVAFLAAFFLFRILLLSLNYSVFSGLAFGQIITAFLTGFKFDFTTVSLLVLPFVFLMILPVKSRAWLKLWAFLLTVEFILLSSILSANLIYFSYVKRHLGEELLSIGNDFSYIIGYAAGDGFWILALFLLVFIVILLFINFLINRLYRCPKYGGAAELFFYILFIAIMFFGMHGRFAKEALNIPDAYASIHSSAAANLALNGIFTSYKVLTNADYMAQNETDIYAAAERTVSSLISPLENIPYPYQYPLMRNLKNVEEMPPKNLIIVLLESWVPKYIDGAVSQTEIKTNYGVTPYFDDLIQQGIYFDNFYAFELRSLQGLTAVLTSVPALPKIKKLGFGLEKINFTKLPEILKNRGYRTIFAQTSERASFNLDKTALMLGFNEVYGKEDMPQQFNYQKQEGYGYDYDMFHLLNQKFAKQEEPFFVFAFTGITHTPYLGVLEGFDKYPNTTEENKYLNALNFADYSIGKFMEQARKEQWFDDTVFIFVADHTFNRHGTLRDKYHIPFLIYAPKFFKPGRVKEVASQLDILPTVFNILNLTENYSSGGRNLLDNSFSPRGALVADGYTIGYITASGALKHSRSKPLEIEIYAPGFDKDYAQQDLLALDKTFFTLLQENRWQRKEN